MMRQETRFNGKIKVVREQGWEGTAKIAYRDTEKDPPEVVDEIELPGWMVQSMFTGLDKKAALTIGEVWSALNGIEIPNWESSLGEKVYALYRQPAGTVEDLYETAVHPAMDHLATMAELSKQEVIDELCRFIAEQGMGEKFERWVDYRIEERTDGDG